MIKSINGWVEDNRNLGMFSKVINGEHVQTYVPPDGNVHRKLALVEAHLTNPMLLRVIPLIFSLVARWRRCALGNAARAVGRYLRGPYFTRGLQFCLCGAPLIVACVAAPLIAACAVSSEREPSELLGR